jgi:hypothetical protein
MVMPPRRALAPVLLVLIGTALLAAVAGGLLRAGVAWSLPEGAVWPGRAAVLHAALMIGAFMGTVIGIERAVAVKHRAAWLAPVASALAGPAMLLGLDGAARWLLVGAAIVFTGVNVVVVRRQRAAHTTLLLAGALCWLAGNLLFAANLATGAVVPWWFAFLVMTIAAERLEMTRLMRRRPGAQASLIFLLALMTLGAAASAIAPAVGGVLYGMSLALLAMWLMVFDIARRTLFAKDLARYMAVCLLGGYVWLAVAGVAWVAAAFGMPTRDAALHALGLGFVFSMMMGDAPVILPAVARVKLLFGVLFYLPLSALHFSLLARLGLGFSDAAWRAQGSLFNAGSMALFAATVVGAVLAWRLKYGPANSGRADGSRPARGSASPPR